MSPRFIRSLYRKEWEIQVAGKCIGHIWYWPLGRCYCLRLALPPMDNATHHATYGKARLSAVESLDHSLEGATS